MEVARIIKELWRLRLWVALVIPVAAMLALSTGYKVGLLPPSLSPKSLEAGIASTQLLIDAPQSALVDEERDVEPLAARAQVFASLVDSETMRAEISRRTGVPAAMIATEGPSLVNQPTQERGASERANEIAVEGARYRVSSQSRDLLPLIEVSAQAPTAEGAVALAEATAQSLEAYVRDSDTSQLPEARRVRISQLGPSKGGLINEGADVSIVVLAFLGLMAAACTVVLVVSSVARNLRVSEVSTAAPPYHNGAVEHYDMPDVPDHIPVGRF